MNTAFTEKLDAYLAWLLHNAGRAEATIAKYRGHLERFASWYAEPPADPALSPAGADPLRPSLEDLELFAGMYAHARGLKAGGRRPLVSALRGFFRWLSYAPAAALVQPKGGLRLPRGASLQEAERLVMAPDIATFDGLRDACMLLLLMGCGIRNSGLCGLNDSSLEWTIEDGRERLNVKVTEKGKRERLVPAPREVATLLRAYLGHDELAAIPRALPSADAVLFVTLNNHNVPACDYYGEARRMTPAAVRGMIKKHAAAAGVRASIAHPHALRHLYGTEMAEDDVPLLVQQSLMGHEDPKSTSIYTATARRKLRETVDRANPLAKMRAPLLDTLRTLGGTVDQARHARSGPHAAQKSKSAQRDRAG